MKIFYRLLIAVFILSNVCQVGNSYAGGTPVRKGVLVLSTSFSYFKASKVWDKNGVSAAYPDSGYFNSGGVYVYGEYGASRRVTLLASLPYSYNTYAQKSFKSTSQGLGEAELGAKYYIGNLDFKFYLGLQGTLIIPLYTNTSTNNLGFGSYGADFKLIGTGNGNLGGDKSCYYTLEIGGRQYFSETGPFQLKSAATFGFNFDKENLVSVSTSGIISTSDNKVFSNNLVQNKDFRYWQASFGAGHVFAPRLSIYVNYTKFLLGRNTGIGTNLSLSVVTKF